MTSKFGGASNNQATEENKAPLEEQDVKDLNAEAATAASEATTAQPAKPTTEQMLQDPQKAIQAGAQSSLTSLQSLALASLEAASHPFAGMLDDGTTGEVVQQKLPAGYYSVYAGRVQLARMKWLSPTSIVGGRFYYALDELSEEAVAALDKLVARGTAELVVDSADAESN